MGGLRGGRGYTGHEHLDEFGLINMNGRVYDPMLGMFLSPDNYIQAPDFTQNYNRYAYCLNNPLMHIDPTGYTWLSHFTGWVKEQIGSETTQMIEAAIRAINVSSINTFELGQDITAFVTAPTAGFLTGFIDKAFNNRGDGTWFGAGFSNGKKMLTNTFTLNRGVSNALSTGSPSTVMGTVLGTNMSLFYNYTNQVRDVKIFHNATVVQLNGGKIEYAMTLGNVIMGSEVATYIEYRSNGDLTLESSVLIHEYGHYLQSLKFGPLHYLRSGLNSASHNVESYDSDAWSERDASLRGLEFFRSLGYSTSGFGEPEWPENLHRDYWNPKIPWL